MRLKHDTPLRQISKRGHSLHQSRGTLDGVPSEVIEVHKVVAHEHDDGVAIAHVRDVVPRVCESALHAMRRGAVLEALLQFRRKRRGYERVHPACARMQRPIGEAGRSRGI